MNFFHNKISLKGMEVEDDSNFSKINNYDIFDKWIEEDSEEDFVSIYLKRENPQYMMYFILEYAGETYESTNKYFGEHDEKLYEFYNMIIEDLNKNHLEIIEEVLTSYLCKEFVNYVMDLNYVNLKLFKMIFRSSGEYFAPEDFLKNIVAMDNCCELCEFYFWQFEDPSYYVPLWILQKRAHSTCFDCFRRCFDNCVLYYPDLSTEEDILYEEYFHNEYCDGCGDCKKFEKEDERENSLRKLFESLISK